MHTIDIDILQAVSVILGVFGFIPYIIAIFLGNTQPQKSSWAAWAVLNFIVLAGMYMKHTNSNQMVAITFGSWVVAALAFKYGKPGWSGWDTTCFIGAILAIALWKIFGDSNFGIGISLVGLFVSGFPLWGSAWKTPEKEDKLTWVIFLLSSIAALLAVEKWSFASVAQPIEFIINQLVTVVLLFTRPPSTKK